MTDGALTLPDSPRALAFLCAAYLDQPGRYTQVTIEGDGTTDGLSSDHEFLTLREAVCRELDHAEQERPVDPTLDRLLSDRFGVKTGPAA